MQQALFQPQLAQKSNNILFEMVSSDNIVQCLLQMASDYTKILKLFFNQINLPLAYSVNETNKIFN